MLDQATLQSLIYYDPESGVAVWLKREETDRFVKAWNTCYAGKPIVSVNGHGYVQICITTDGVKKRYELHRIIWLYVHSEMPANLDHDNRIKLDNRLVNLRVATTSLNGHNVGLTKRNTSGVKGVHWHKAARKWQASIAMAGKEKYLGLFESLDDAKAAYAAASIAYAKEFSVFAKVAA